ncbi:low molecular weight phosphotyrosine protein phosphatase [Bizionia gelidisalsuginis]|uniref:protein-tyrosine-phosphatase n=2 Tax=Bizionia TaxID=283785 RepID=A0A8H2LEA6_9FLAO|nr:MULTISPECIES: low molecular weight protein-tyrosine-phosphatase [Bizionia]TYB77391.1 low molecular weight phosphotyrosine protein phosphatase [Bizionia saleffrena]TYC17927.1 low molecular weight phosphotyrosine protein phosphatase [Bizionia gelidisalsuginis]
MTKILMVCLGNICRSPLAQGILESKLDTPFIVDSAATSNYHIGSPPDPRSIAIAKKFGLDISKQSGRQFNVDDFDTFDTIYAMDSSNYENIIKCARNPKDISKVKLILNESHPNKNLDVPDPYFGGDSGFLDVYNLLDVACNAIAEKLKV